MIVVCVRSCLIAIVYLFQVIFLHMYLPLAALVVHFDRYCSQDDSKIHSTQYILSKPTRFPFLDFFPFRNRCDTNFTPQINQIRFNFFFPNFIYVKN